MATLRTSGWRKNAASGHGAYGKSLGDCFRVGNPRAFVSKAPPRARIAVTEIRCDTAEHGPTIPLPREDSFLVAVHARECLKRQLWLEDCPVPAPALPAGVTTFYDLKRSPYEYYSSPFHAVMFYLPRKVLDAVGEEIDAFRTDDLNYEPGVGVDDVTLRGLAYSLLPRFVHARESCDMFAEHVMFATAAYIAAAYGAMRVDARPVRGRLAAWQQRRAEDILRSSTDGDVSLVALAAGCGLSPVRFCRAFRRSTGMSPYRWWLAQHRTDEGNRSNALMHSSGVSPRAQRNRN